MSELVQFYMRDCDDNPGECVDSAKSLLILFCERGIHNDEVLGFVQDRMRRYLAGEFDSVDAALGLTRRGGRPAELSWDDTWRLLLDAAPRIHAGENKHAVLREEADKLAERMHGPNAGLYIQSARRLMRARWKAHGPALLAQLRDRDKTD